MPREKNSRSGDPHATVRSREVMMKRCLIVIFWMFAALEVFAQEEYPLQPADISSPRATLNSFMDSCEEVYILLQQQGRDIDDAGRQQAEDAVRAISRCMDVSEIAEFRREHILYEAAVALKEVLDRIELPRESHIPDAKMIVQPDGSMLKRWTIPNTEITLHLIEEGPLTGYYQFTPYTITHAVDFLRRVKHLPYKKGATEGFAATYLTTPGSPWLAEVVERLPDELHHRWKGLALWQWIGVVCTLLGGAIIMAILYATGRRISRLGSEGNVIRYSLGLIFPIGAVLVPAKASSIITQDLVISGPILYTLKFNLALLVLLASMVVVLGVGRRVGEIIAAIPHIKTNSIDAQLARLMSRVVAMIAAMVLLLQGGQHLGIPLSSLLAGAGVVGAALALSAQDFLKNIFGSIMIVMDRPYCVGERIKIKGYDGVVEEVGLRSTKIRLLNGHQAIIPNEDMARSDIENVGRRPFIRRVSDLRLALDIGKDKALQAVELIQDLLDGHEGQHPDYPPRVWLNDLKSDHIELRMIYWYHPPDYWKYTAHADETNRRILETLGIHGIGLAAPAFTTKVEDSSAGVLPLPDE